MDVTFGEWTFAAELLYRPDFRSLDDFWVEGSQDVEVKDGHLFVRTAKQKNKEATYVSSVFSKRYFKGDLLVEYTARDTGTDTQGNFNLFLHTTDPSGRDLYETRGERSGEYGEYHLLNNYLFTFLRSNVDGEGQDTPRARYRLRRDPGFVLKKEAHSYEWALNRWYRFKFLSRAGVVGISVDEHPFETYCWRDPQPLSEGYLAFRTFCSHLEIKDCSVYQVG